MDLSFSLSLRPSRRVSFALPHDRPVVATCNLNVTWEAQVNRILFYAGTHTRARLLITSTLVLSSVFYRHSNPFLLGSTFSTFALFRPGRQVAFGTMCEKLAYRRIAAMSSDRNISRNRSVSVLITGPSAEIYDLRGPDYRDRSSRETSA